MPHDITLIPGDGIGPEITDATVRALEATDVHFHWDIKEAGIGSAEKHGAVLPDDLLHSIRNNRVALKGPITTPPGAAASAPSTWPSAISSTSTPVSGPLSPTPVPPPATRTSTSSSFARTTKTSTLA